MCLDVRGIQCGAVPVDVTSGVGFRLQRLKDALPRAIAPPAYEAVVNEPGTLSGFQKDIYNTYLTVVKDPASLKGILNDAKFFDTGGDRSAALARSILWSPSFLTLLSAAAELNDKPTLSPNIQDGIQELITAVATPLQAPAATAIPAVDTALLKFYAISQSPAYINSTKALSQVMQRRDFLPFAQKVAPADLVIFIPLATKLSLQLPIDAPDSSTLGSLFSVICIGVIVWYSRASNPAIFHSWDDWSLVRFRCCNVIAEKRDGRAVQIDIGRPPAEGLP